MRVTFARSTKTINYRSYVLTLRAPLEWFVQHNVTAWHYITREIRNKRTLLTTARTYIYIYIFTVVLKYAIRKDLSKSYKYRRSRWSSYYYGSCVTRVYIAPRQLRRSLGDDFRRSLFFVNCFDNFTTIRTRRYNEDSNIPPLLLAGFSLSLL